MKSKTSCVSCAPVCVGHYRNQPNASSDTVSSPHGESSLSCVMRDFPSVHRSEVNVVGQVDVNDLDGYGGAAINDMCNMDGSEKTVRSATSVCNEVSVSSESSSIVFDIDSKLAEVYGEPLQGPCDPGQGGSYAASCY